MKAEKVYENIGDTLKPINQDSFDNAFKELIDEWEINDPEIISFLEEMVKSGWELDNFETDSMSIKNPNDVNIYFEIKDSKLYGYVDGYKQSIYIGDYDMNPEEIKELSDIDHDWIKENDPHGDRW